ncbi:Beta-mannosyltransferase 1 [Sorochytrium milnesiophthora]
MLEHSFRALPGHEPPLRMFFTIGSLSVRIFFVLSAFLITYRLLLEWHQVKLQKAAAARVDAGGRHPSTVAPASDLEEQTYNSKKHDAPTKSSNGVHLSQPVFGAEMGILGRFVVQRFFRVYPLYFLASSVAFSCASLRQAYLIDRDDYTWWKHITLQQGQFVFWTVGVEMKFYAYVPLLVIAYHFATRARVPHTFVGRAVRLIMVGAFWTCILVTIGASVSEAHRHPIDNDNRLDLVRWQSVFLSGCVAAIAVFELQVRGRLPDHSRPTENRTAITPVTPVVLPDIVRQRLHPKAADIVGQTLALAKTAEYIRCYLDVACYALVAFWLATSPLHYAQSPSIQRLFGSFITNNYIRNTEQLEGIPIALIIMASLYAYKSFARMFEASALVFLGRISFSLYIWHPVLLYLVYSVWLPDTVIESDHNTVANVWWDKPGMLKHKLLSAPFGQSAAVHGRRHRLAALCLLLVVLCYLIPGARRLSVTRSQSALPKDWRMPASLAPLRAGSDGCYASAASSRLTIASSLALKTDMDAFSTSFMPYFAFNQTADDWEECSGSGVWLESHQVYISSTRIMRRPKHFNGRVRPLLESWIFLRALDPEFRPTTLRYQVTDDVVVAIPEVGLLVPIEDVMPANNYERGPEDARMHVDLGGHLLFTFNMATPTGRPYFSYNMTERRLLRLSPEGDQSVIQKNWAAINVDSYEMHAVHNFNPFRVLRCSNGNGLCRLVVDHGGQGVSRMRGGTPFLRYGNTDYFLGIGRTALDCSTCNARIYRPNLVVVHAPNSQHGIGPNVTDYSFWDVVYVSEPLDFDKVPISPPYVPSSTPDFCGSFMLPTGFLRWQLGDGSGRPDEAFIELSIQDNINVVVKVSGLEQLVVDIIASTTARRSKLKASGVRWTPMASSQVQCAENKLIQQCPPSPRSS